MASMNDKGMVLGQQVAAPERYAPEVLFPIPRQQGREGIQTAWDAGADDWTGWEVSWLDPNGMPDAGVLQLRVPADSPHIVESKSLKLYLNSLNFTAFDSRQVLLDTLRSDIAGCIGSPVQLDLLDVGSAMLRPESATRGDCLDVLVPEDLPESVDASVLQVDTGQPATQCLYTRLFRSCCPVTGQPDWASVFVEHDGAAISPVSLLAYLLGYRRHQGFHEQCVESVFSDIHAVTQSQCLRVSARFLRRGGLEINPWRSIGTGFGPLPGRQPRQ
ncbi:MAG: NADPH-dependent 7-cyano-7-deazaguanine reductase QueF [Gammaproteobacteria bacterium]|nr:MAG: NADPH-dependent 7-cyano-7-deazaguanine reductase QueF [Gammaproteobacteria bacterium]